MGTSVNLSGYTVVQEEGASLPPRYTLDFQGAGVTAAEVLGKTVVTIPGSGTSTPILGSFYDTTTQSTASGVAKAMELNTTDISAGVSITNNALGRPTRMTVNTTGIYNLQFSAQLVRTVGGTAKEINIWININDIVIPWSNGIITMQANSGEAIAAWNYYISLTAGDYVELMWTQNDGIDILATPADVNHPETPSLIATMNKIN